MRACISLTLSRSRLMDSFWFSTCSCRRWSSSAAFWRMLSLIVASDNRCGLISDTAVLVHQRQATVLDDLAFLVGHGLPLSIAVGAGFSLLHRGHHIQLSDLLLCHVPSFVNR